ncbi:hypothetical protein ACEQPO_03100 [Bacillus sp. SL00103]
MKLFQTEYPDGLAVHNYEELFGTMRTVIFRPEEGTIDYCFGSQYTIRYSLKAGVHCLFMNRRFNFIKKDYGPSFWRNV